jgi:uncharacterized protein (DUF2267 family)
MLVRGVYYAKWDPSKVPMKLNREEFLQRIRREFPYEVEGDIEQLERTVLQALRRYITNGEWDDIKAARYFQGPVDRCFQAVGSQTPWRTAGP